MKLKAPFIKLPFRFDAARLAEEAASAPADAWAEHPNQIPGNSALRLITVDGQENDGFAGPMAPTPHLARMPYVRQILAQFSVVWGRSRLMRLAPGSTVPPHTDINYHWFQRVRLHVPIVTDPGVRFFIADEEAHMAPGEAWLIDNWSMHRVENRSDVLRVHLVADTTGGADFWAMAEAARTGQAPERFIPFDPAKDAQVLTERFNIARVLSPADMFEVLHDLEQEAASKKLGDAGAQQVARFSQVVAGYCQDWRRLWSLYGDTDEGVPHYRQRVQRLVSQVEALGDGLYVRANGSPMARVVARRVAASAVNIGPDGPFQRINA
ncbi:aspartyl/asparaginyl beta-hydroxylase domain-containing protein [Brevundimonas sp. 2R-24]|uniref:Aspartyl/asparaginyl beta-hydroxylase domain-containing protein n=1 Tax=Peiella sedimenti TaxID=3061083 RepID=A0ABT8SR11_9CAUL|nr:aspartyl/asparaginyl beta-hydroxylase domain-containing protein [Caulobacteraceae bacterium XZ-24]